MRCEEARPLLDLHADDRLDQIEAARLEAHLSACTDCREEADGLRSVASLVREIPRPAAPDGFAESVLSRLPPRPVVRTNGRRIGAWFLAPLAVAACVLLIARMAGDPHAELGVPEGAVATESSRYETATRIAASESPGEAFDDAEGALAAGKIRDGNIPTGEVAMGPPGAPAGPSPVPIAPAKESRVSDPAWGDDSRSYLVVGVEPDATAGVVLAELDHRRDREATARGSSAASTGISGDTERVGRDEDGSPTVLVLSLTEAEEDYLVGLLVHRGELSRLGVDLDREEAGEPGPGSGGGYSGGGGGGGIGIGGGAGGQFRQPESEVAPPASGAPPESPPAPEAAGRTEPGLVGESQGEGDLGEDERRASGSLDPKAPLDPDAPPNTPAPGGDLRGGDGRRDVESKGGGKARRPVKFRFSR